MEQNSKINIITSLFRLGSIFFLIISQLVLFYFYLVGFNIIYSYFYIILQVVVIITLLVILGSNKTHTYKLSWSLFIVFFPFAGMIFYLIYGPQRLLRKRTRIEKKVNKKLHINYSNNKNIELINNSDSKSQVALINKVSSFPTYNSNDVKYFKIGEEYFDDIILKLKKANKYILLEHYIISDGILFNRIFDVLMEKANSGVEIFFMYDTLGSFTTVPKDKLKLLKQNNVKVVSFNSSVSSLYGFFNYRSHRKITVIDGIYAYTGGNNISDEYINEVERFGHWKDMGIRIGGDSVRTFIDIFFKMWVCETNDDIILNEYYSTNVFKKSTSSFITPIADSPTDKETTAKYLFIKMITSAKKYIYITTPYLIIDDEMTTALTVAAKSGVDVKILVPGIPDKKFIYYVTKAHFGALIDSGVKIYAYTPGFVHGKTIVSDNMNSFVGSINFDYRSLLWNYECGVHVINDTIATEITKDFNDSLELSTLFTKKTWKRSRHPSKIFNGVLKLIGPLL